MNILYIPFYTSISTIIATFISILVVLIVYISESNLKYKSMINDTNDSISRLSNEVRIIINESLNKVSPYYKDNSSVSSSIEYQTIEKLKKKEMKYSELIGGGVKIDAEKSSEIERLIRTILDLAYEGSIEEIKDIYFKNYIIMDSVLPSKERMELILRFMEIDRLIREQKIYCTMYNRYNFISNKKINKDGIIIGLIALSIGGIILPIYMLTPIRIGLLSENVIMYLIIIILVLGFIMIFLCMWPSSMSR